MFGGGESSMVVRQLKRTCYCFRPRLMLEIISYLIHFFIYLKIFFQPLFLYVIYCTSWGAIEKYGPMAKAITSVEKD